MRRYVMRKVKIIEEKIREVFESRVEYFLGDSEVDIVEIKYAITDDKYTVLFIYRSPSSEG